jgi:hypothetical protein
MQSASTGLMGSGMVVASLPSHNCIVQNLSLARNLLLPFLYASYDLKYCLLQINYF